MRPAIDRFVPDIGRLRLTAGRWLAALLLLIAGCSCPALARDEAADPVAADSAGSRHGFLWEARKGARHAYLMGTLHVGLASDYPPDGATQHLLAGVDAFALEDDVSQAQRTQDAVRSLAMYPAGEPGLDGRIDAQLKADCERELGALGLPAAGAWRMKPWLLGSAMVILQASALGFSPSYATEVYLAQLARSLNRPIIELEGIEAQFALLDASPWPQQVDFLRQTVSSIRSGEAENDLRALVAAWRASDAAAMTSYLDRVRHSDDPVERLWFARLVTQRNAGMAASIERLLQDGRLYLVAVGSLHYFGDDGLVETLRKRGYTVTALPQGASR